ncbi:MAG: DUF502 domain-containing protein [Blastochloris sp.]|nr:DUF502 domain-containing protein [Blastochloris sp.]
MSEPKESAPLIWLRNKFLTGLFVVIPLFATFWILKFLYKVMSGFAERLVKTLVEVYRPLIPNFLIVDGTIPFAALFITLATVIAVGLLATNVFGRKIVEWIESALHRVPLVNLIYPVAKQVVESLKELGNAQTEESRKPVVFLRYPGTLGYFIGFQTGRFKSAEGKRMVTVFLPTAPNPITGFVLAFEETDVVNSDIKYEDAWKMIVSGGLVTPKNISFGTTTTAAVPVPIPVDTKQTG